MWCPIVRIHSPTRAKHYKLKGLLNNTSDAASDEDIQEPISTYYVVGHCQEEFQFCNTIQERFPSLCTIYTHLSYTSLTATTYFEKI